MFTNILRAQARLALTSCRSRVPVSPISRVVARFPSLPPVSPVLRSISTSRPVWNALNPMVGNTESNTLYLGNLPFSITEEEIREKFEPFGQIQDIRLAYHPDGRTRGFAHVQFRDLHDSIAAFDSFKEEPLYILDRDIRIDYAAVRKQNIEPTLTLYFHGFTGTMDNLRQATSDFESDITNMFFLKDRETGMETGAGFINFTTVARAEEALQQLNGRDCGDDVLRVRYAAPKRERPQRRRSEY